MRLRRSTGDGAPDADAVAAGQASAAAARVEASLLVPLDPTAAAFFDVDNTVMQGASIFHLARGLYTRDFFTARDIGRFAWQQGKFRLLGREDMNNVHEARETALSFAAGHTVAELTTIGEEVFDEVMAAKVWPGTRALAQMHLDAGQRVWLVTATPVEVASVIAERLGLTGALGTVAETERRCLHRPAGRGDPARGGQGAGRHRARRARGAATWAPARRTRDSANDIPLLSLVGHPCAINPDARLRAHAREHGWRVRDYRTGRKAVKVGVPTAAAAGALAGGAGRGGVGPPEGPLRAIWADLVLRDTDR